MSDHFHHCPRALPGFFARDAPPERSETGSIDSDWLERSRKASPLPRARPRLRAIPGQERVQMVIFPPEKAHQRHKTGVKRCRHREVLKSLTFRQPLKNTQSLPALTLDSSTGVFSQPRSRKYSPKDCAWRRGRLESRKSSPSRISSPWYRDPPEKHAHQPVSAQRFR